MIYHNFSIEAHFIHDELCYTYIKLHILGMPITMHDECGYDDHHFH